MTGDGVGRGDRDASPPLHIRRRLFVLVAVFFVLAWASSAAVLVYGRFGYAFGDPVSFGSLLSDMASIGPIDVVTQFADPEFMGQFKLGMVAMLAAVVGAETIWRERRSVVILSAAVVAVPIGLLALAALVTNWTVGHDGEWLAEGWPALEAWWFWSVALVTYAVPEVGEVRRRSPSTPHDRLAQFSRTADDS